MLQVGPGDSRVELLVTADQFYLYRLRLSCGPDKSAAVFLAPVSRPDTDGTLALVFQAPTKLCTTKPIENGLPFLFFY